MRTTLCIGVVMVFTALALLGGCGGGGKGGGTAAANAGTPANSMSDPDSGAGGSSSSAGGSSATAGSASGDAGESTGGTPGMLTMDVDALLEEVSLACEADCDAILATECPPANVNRPTCELQCVVQTNTLGEFCLSEYAALVNCRAAGGYACVNDFAVAESNCPSEQSAFSMCTVDLGCKRYCAAARDGGCGGDSLDGCIEACLAGRDDFPMNCNYRYDALRLCQGTTNAECVDGELTTAQPCSYQVVSLAECISDETMDLCSGWCYAAEELGCPLADCATQCPAQMMDETCGVQFTDMVDCGMFFSDVGCMEEQLVGTSICDTETSAYLMCLNPPPPMP
jgi:hypothetical protein